MLLGIKDLMLWLIVEFKILSIVYLLGKKYIMFELLLYVLWFLLMRDKLLGMSLVLVRFVL